MPGRGEMGGGQDWSTVSFGNKPSSSQSAANKNASLKDAQRNGGQIDTSKKYGGGGNKQVTAAGLNAARLENEDEELSHTKVSTELKTAIQKARTAKGLTQKQLAQQLNMQPQIINEYEQGKGVPNNQIIAKIEKALGAKLPRVKK